VPRPALLWHRAHAGFGLGFERLVQFMTGMGNIRDVIPFSRTPDSIDAGYDVLLRVLLAPGDYMVSIML
jgi:hypothetical protein